MKFFNRRFILITLGCIVLSSNLLLGQTIRSNGTGGGDWNSGSTWQGGTVPSAPFDVVIMAGDSVNITTASTASITVKSLTIQSNAKLANSFSTETISLLVTEAFTIAANGWYYGNSGSVTSWPMAGSYNIDPASNYVQTTAGSSTIGAVGRATFGNLINAKTGAGSEPGTSLTILGNLIIRTGAEGTTFRGTRGDRGNLTHRVYGNVNVISGQWSAVDAPNANGLTCVWNIDGNVTIGDPSTAVNMARFGPFTSADGGFSRFGTFNIGGNLILCNGARFQAGSSTGNSASTEVGTINLKGDLITEASTRYATNSWGTFNINFVGTGTQKVRLGAPLRFASTSHRVTINNTIDTGSNVVFEGGFSWEANCPTPANGNGEWVVNGSLAMKADTIKGLQGFKLNDGATLIISKSVGLAGNGDIQSSGPKTFSEGANYVFNGTLPQVTGVLMPATVNNLTIDNPAGVALSQPTTINGVLDLKAGEFDNTIPFTLGPSGSIAYNGGSLKNPVNFVKELFGNIPETFFVSQNYPNPFNPSTIVRFGIPASAFVNAKVYNLLGKEVASLLSEYKSAGVYELTFQASNLSSGIYFFRVEAGNYVDVKRMLLIK